MKNVLVLGASGAMGLPLLDILNAEHKYDVYATSRKQRESGSVHWICGNGKDDRFLAELLSRNRFDAVVDFLNYTTDEFKRRYELLLDNTEHLIFLSSARVYAQIDGVINESYPRILDTSDDAQYLSGDPYELAKARQENILNGSTYRNYTIIRPSLTYNSERLQFTLFEKDEWIYRVLDGNSIIFPKEMANIKTTMTYGKDVAYAISRLLFDAAACGETFNVSGGGCRTWGDILDIYTKAIEDCTKKCVKIREVSDAGEIAKKLNRFSQYKNARGINREFSNEKIEGVIGRIEWETIETGLSQCVRQFFDQGANVSWPHFRQAAYLDRIAHEHTPLRRFDTWKQRAGYILYRTGVYRQ